MKTKINFILYTAGALAFLLMLVACEGEEKVLSPFVTDPGVESQLDEASLEGGTHFSGLLENADNEVVGILADEDYTGEVVKDPKIEMTLKINESGRITAGQFTMKVYDRETAAKAKSNAYFTYEAECGDGTKKLCGTLKDRELSIDFEDGVGHIELRSDKRMSKENELFGTITVDGKAKKLGEFSLTKDLEDPTDGGIQDVN